MIRNTDFRVRIPPAITIYAQKCWGVKFYGSSVSGARTGDAVDLTANVGDDSNGPVTNDFDTQPLFGQIHDVDEVARNASGVAYTDSNGKTISNKMVYIPRFWMSFTLGTDSNGSYSWYQVANYPKEGFWPAFKKLDGSLAKFALVAKYKGTYLSSNHLDVIGAVKEMPPCVSMSTSTETARMSYILDSGLGIASITRLLCGRTWAVHNALDFLMKVEFATTNQQTLLPGVIYESWFSVKDYESYNVWGTATNYISLPTTHYMVAGTNVGTKVCLYISDTQWQLRTIVDKVADTDSNGAQSGYTRLTLSGDAFTMPSGSNIYFFHTWAIPAGMTDVIKASSGNCTVLSDGNTSGTGHHAFKYRGIENPWGSLWEFVGDMAMKDVHDGTANKLTMIRYKSGSTLNTPATYEEDDGLSLPVSSGWQKLTQPDGGNLVPTEVGASDNTYLCDYYWVSPRTTAGTSYFQVLVGASGYYGSEPGPRALGVYGGFGYAYYYIACRPCLLA